MARYLPSSAHHPPFTLESCEVDSYSHKQLLKAREVLETAEKQAISTVKTARQKAAVLLGKARTLRTAHSEKRVASCARKTKQENELALLLLEHKLRKECRSGALRVAGKLAEAVIRHEFNATSLTIIRRLEQLLETLLPQTPLTIEANAADLEELQSALKISQPLFELTFKANPIIAPGDAKICSHAGCIELRWEEDLAHYTQQMGERL